MRAPDGFDTIMPKTLATAAVDRLLHHAHIVLTEGTSLRPTGATSDCQSQTRGAAPDLTHSDGDHLTADREIRCPPTETPSCPLTLEFTSARVVNRPPAEAREPR